MFETGVTNADLAEFAVLMRNNARRHPDSHLTQEITVADVLASKPIAEPLRLMDCCPISDGAMALIVSSEPGAGVRVKMVGAGQAHFHQHLTALQDVMNTGAGAAAAASGAEAAAATCAVVDNDAGQDRHDAG